MGRIFITGSTDGLGLMAARLLVENGHKVTLHARNEERAADVHSRLSHAEHVVIGDFATIAGMMQVADQANALGRYDAVIHNAGIGYRESKRLVTPDGLSHVFAINVLAPFVLTARMTRPERLVYVSSGMHRSGNPDMSDLQWARRRWNGAQAYADSKLFDVVIAFGAARLWPDVLSNALEPGWTPTKMGGPEAPDDIQQAPLTQVWLAASDSPEVRVSGQYYYHKKSRETHPAAIDPNVQDALFDACAELSGVRLS